MTEAPLAYSIPSAVKASGLTRTRIYELLGNGQLSAVKCGRRTLIPAESLTAMLAALPPAAMGQRAKPV